MPRDAVAELRRRYGGASSGNGPAAEHVSAVFGGAVPAPEDDAEPTTQDWPASPSLPGPPDPDPLPVEVLPLALRLHVWSVAAAMQVPADLPCLLSLGAVSAAVAGRAEVEVRAGWREPVGIYAACILPPASRKSPAYSAMTAPVREWEGEQIREAAPAVAAARDRVAVRERALEQAIRAAAAGNGSDTEVADARQALSAAEAVVPHDGRLLAGDITPEALGQRLAVQDGRCALLEPEPGPLRILAGRYSDSGPRLEEVKKCWTAEAIIVDRSGREAVRVERPALTLCLCLQPGVIESLPAPMRYEGALGRILWCCPPHGLGCRLTGADVPPLDTEAEAEYHRVVRRLLDVPTPDDGPHVLTLSAAAREILHAEEARVERELADGGAYEEARDWAGKMVGQSVRVAALLALARRAETGADLWRPIDGEAMAAGVAMLQALGTHALRVLVGAGDDGRTADLRYLLRRSQALPQPATMRDLREATRGRASIGGAEALEDLVADLAARGCVRVVPQPSSGGRPPSPRVELHPALRPEAEAEEVVR